MKTLIAAAAAVLLLAGCAATDSADEPSVAPEATSQQPSEPTETPTEEPVAELTATEIATSMQGEVDTIADIVTITEENDPNDLIGRPTGYVDAATIYDSALSCTELGTDCGATIEIWSDAESAQARADYIMGILEDTPAFGTEYHFVHGSVLLRVTGDLVPSVAEQYEAAFEATFD